LDRSTGLASNVIADAFVVQDNGTGNSVCSNTARVCPVIGQFAAGAGFSLVDDDGTMVRFSLRGPGVGQVLAHDAGFDLFIAATDVRSTLKIHIDKGGDGRAQVVNIYSDATLKTIAARKVDLVGRLNVNGGLKKLVLGRVMAGGEIEIGDQRGQGRAQGAVTVNLGPVVGASLTSRIPIKSLIVSQWRSAADHASFIEAPRIGKLHVAGDFEADLDLGSADTGYRSLTRAKIRGRLRNASWVIRGNIGRIEVAKQVDNWHLDHDGNLAVLKLQQVGSATVDSGQIRSLIAKQWNHGHVSAASIRSFRAVAGRTRGGRFAGTWVFGEGKGALVYPVAVPST